ncbi:MAG: hypothetical protein ACREL5_05875 [Gemmatimonadales bacterium]
MYLRRIKAALVHALLWAAAWAVAGVFLEFLQASHGLTGHSLLELVPLIPSMAAYWAAVGFASGLLVAGILMLAERNRTLDQISLRRMAAWGAVPGVFLPLLTHVQLAYRGLFMVRFLTGNVEMAVILGCVGAGLAAGELRAARALPPGRDPVPAPDQLAR